MGKWFEFSKCKPLNGTLCICLTDGGDYALTRYCGDTFSNLMGARGKVFLWRPMSLNDVDRIVKDLTRFKCPNCESTFQHAGDAAPLRSGDDIYCDSCQTVLSVVLDAYVRPEPCREGNTFPGLETLISKSPITQQFTTPEYQVTVRISLQRLKGGP